MTHRCKKSSGLWKVWEPGQDQHHALGTPWNGAAVSARGLGTPQSPLTPSLPPRSWCGMSLSSRARSTSSPPTATAPRSTASAPCAPARSRAGREWGSRGTAPPPPGAAGSYGYRGGGGWRPPEPFATRAASSGRLWVQRAQPGCEWGGGLTPPAPAGGQASSTAASRGSSSCWSAASTRAGRRGAAATPTTWRGCAPFAPSPVP